MRRSDPRRGNALIEFTLVGIPLLFTLISIFEMGRGMWQYVTLCHAVKDTTRFAVVHGDNCASVAQSCVVTVAQVAARFRQSGGGLDPANVQLELRSGCLAGAKFDSGACATVKTGTLTSLLADGASWPDFGAPGFESVEILATYQFRTAFAMLWPGAGVVRPAGAFVLHAVSREMVQF